MALDLDSLVQPPEPKADDSCGNVELILADPPALAAMQGQTRRQDRNDLVNTEAVRTSCGVSAI
jgi:hypothetical protein